MVGKSGVERKGATLGLLYKHRRPSQAELHGELAHFRVRTPGLRTPDAFRLSATLCPANNHFCIMGKGQRHSKNAGVMGAESLSYHERKALGFGTVQQRLGKVRGDLLSPPHSS